MFSIISEKKNMYIYQQSAGMSWKISACQILAKIKYRASLVSTQQETQQPTAEGWAGHCAAYGEQTQTQPETNPSLGALASFPDFSVRWIQPAISLVFPCQCLPLPVSLPLPVTFSFPFLPLSLVHDSTVLIIYFLTSLFLCVYQTCGHVTWWSWCWRFLYHRSLTASVTCCCVRSGFYWACSTATLLCERSVHLMSTGETFCTGIIFSGFIFVAGHAYNKGFFPLPPSFSTRLVFLVSGGPGGRPPSGGSVALGLGTGLHKKKTDFLIYKARRVDTVSE